MDLLGLGKISDKGFETFSKIYPDLAQPAVKKVGYALETVFDLCNTILLPLKLINSNSQLFFYKHMDNYRKKLESMEESQLVTVPPTLGLRVIDELLTTTNEDVAELFLNLLTNASNIDTVKYAHPGFIDIIKNLSQDEAKIINDVFTKDNIIIHAQIVKIENGGRVPLDKRVTDLTDQVVLDFNENVDLYMNNLIRCAIIEDQNLIRRIDLDKYNILVEKMKSDVQAYETELKKQQEKGEFLDVSIAVNRGRYKLTAFGESFINCVSVK